MASRITAIILIIVMILAITAVVLYYRSIATPVNMGYGILNGVISESQICGTTTIGNGTGCIYRKIYFYATSLANSNINIKFNSSPTKAMYNVSLPSGSYKIQLAMQCSNPCQTNLPINVVISPNVITTLNVTVNFGAV